MTNLCFWSKPYKFRVKENSTSFHLVCCQNSNHPVSKVSRFNAIIRYSASTGFWLIKIPQPWFNPLSWQRCLLRQKFFSADLFTFSFPSPFSWILGGLTCLGRNSSNMAFSTFSRLVPVSRNPTLDTEKRQQGICRRPIFSSRTVYTKYFYATLYLKICFPSDPPIAISAGKFLLYWGEIALRLLPILPGSLIWPWWLLVCKACHRSTQHC